MKTSRPLSEKLNLCPLTHCACERAAGRGAKPAVKPAPDRELEELLRSLRGGFRYDPALELEEAR